MTWEQLYPIVREQADYAILRYDDRRQDKVQELVCQAYEKYRSDTSAGREIKKQSFKCFVTQPAKQLDLRSVVKGGYGGTSRIDVLGNFNRRPNGQIFVEKLDEWMPMNMKSREAIQESLTFSIDYSFWMKRLTNIQRQTVEYLIQGFRLKEIAKKLKANLEKVRKIIEQIRDKYRLYFLLEVA